MVIHTVDTVHTLGNGDYYNLRHLKMLFLEFHRLTYLYCLGSCSMGSMADSVEIIMGYLDINVSRMCGEICQQYASVPPPCVGCSGIYVSSMRGGQVKHIEGWLFDNLVVVCPIDFRTTS